MVTELRARLDEAFGPDQGHVTRVLHRHFGADSTAAVQHQVKTAVAELLTESRERLFRQFSSAEESNPLASFQKHAVAAIRQSSDQQHAHLREMNQRIGALQLEIAKLQAEREKALDVAAEHERSTAKGRPYEEAVFEAIDAIAGGAGRRLRRGRRPAGRRRAQGRRAGGDRRLLGLRPRPDRLRGQELARGQEGRARGARRARWPSATPPTASGSFPSEEQLPARTQPLREVNGDKLFVVYDPEEGGRLALQVAYALARARVLMARGDAEGLDASAVRAEVERALGALEEGRRIRQQLTHAANGVEAAREILDAMERRVKAHLAQVDVMLGEAGAGTPGDGED